MSTLANAEKVKYIIIIIVDTNILYIYIYNVIQYFIVQIN